ncbi:hypothetical protein ABZ638_34135, partial [Streptomyces sp. NPDC007107]
AHGRHDQGRLRGPRRLRGRPYDPRLGALVLHARRVHGRRVRYVIGDEPGQVNGMRWRPGSAP